jgi:rhodanese-related sulfurtransferase
MKKLILILLLASINLYSQNNLGDLLKKYNTESIPYISIDRLKTISNNVILLDTREAKEYQVSHLKNTILVGYDNFDLSDTTSKLKDKNKTIVVYCSVGIRSEDIAEKLKKAGYKNIYNLYGEIFEWKNKGNIIFDTQNKPTHKVHIFNIEWS